MTDLDLNEMVVLSAAGPGPLEQSELVKTAVAILPSTKFDAPVANNTINELVARRYLERRKSLVRISEDGREALRAARPVLRGVSDTLLGAR